MYLSLLNTEQKKLFLSLAYNLAKADGTFDENEREVIQSYLAEMNTEIKLEDVDESINCVVRKVNTVCGIREKKIMIFEMIGLAMADYNYDTNEREIVKEALSVWGLDTEFSHFCENKLSEYFSLQEELNTKILY